MKRRGVSPVIATVILIAVAITVAVGVSYWVNPPTQPLDKDSAIQETAMISCLTYGFETNDSENIIALNIYNNGTMILNITEVLVNDLLKDFSGENIIEPGDESILIIYSAGWVSGEECHIVIKTDNKSVSRKSTSAP